MRKNGLLFSLALCSCLVVTARADDPFDLKVLYAGNPGSSREKDFVDLLKASIKHVETADYRSFTEDQAVGHDVIIFDWTSIYPRDKDGKVLERIDRFDYPATPKLSEKYDRPTFIIGGPGQRVVRKLKLKIDWLCLCLDEAAHGLAIGHDIFRTPLKVSPTLEEIPTPAHYPGLASGSQLGKTIKTWKVQTKKFPEVDPGLVSDGYMFEDSPDAEIICSGLNEKGPQSVAMGRQANFLLWGFSAAPVDMTSEARRCFINAVIYIKRFDGQRPIVRADANAYSRGRSLMAAHLAKFVVDQDAFRRMNPELVRLAPDRVAKQRELELFVLGQMFPEVVRTRAARDPNAYVAWIKENFEWLRAGPDHDGTIEIALDDDVKALGLSNHKIDLLDACVAMLERNDRIEMALRVLQRYTTVDFDDVKGWRAWLDANRDRLFFTESGGYKFMVAPQSVIVPSRKDRLPLSVTDSPMQRMPVIAEASFSPDRVRRGDGVTFVVRVTIAPAWHISALQGSKGPKIATSLSLSLPRGIETDGDWTFPEPIPGSDGRLIHAGVVEFRRRLRVTEEFPTGAIAATCTLSYQACDRFSCRPPDQSLLEATAQAIGK